MTRRKFRSIRGLAARIQAAPLGAFVALSLAFPALAGTTSGTAMPWETPLQTVQESITGPVAKAIGIIAIAVTGSPSPTLSAARIAPGLTNGCRTSSRPRALRSRLRSRRRSGAG